jgi:hypothetical protein
MVHSKQITLRPLTLTHFTYVHGARSSVNFLIHPVPKVRQSTTTPYPAIDKPSSLAQDISVKSSPQAASFKPKTS